MLISRLNVTVNQPKGQIHRISRVNQLRSLKHLRSLLCPFQQWWFIYYTQLYKKPADQLISPSLLGYRASCLHFLKCFFIFYCLCVQAERLYKRLWVNIDIINPNGEQSLPCTLKTLRSWISNVIFEVHEVFWSPEALGSHTLGSHWRWKFSLFLFVISFPVFHFVCLKDYDDGDGDDVICDLLYW